MRDSLSGRRPRRGVAAAARPRADWRRRFLPFARAVPQDLGPYRMKLLPPH